MLKFSITHLDEYERREKMNKIPDITLWSPYHQEHLPAGVPLVLYHSHLSSLIAASFAAVCTQL